MAKVPDDSCSISRSLGVLGERWTLLIVREAVDGHTRFSEFRDKLQISTDILTDRIETLVSHGVLERVPYRQPGSRVRFEYVLTPAGRDLDLVLAALKQWGDEYLPWPQGPTVLHRVSGDTRPVHVGFVDDRGREVAQHDVDWVRTAAHPLS